jgi:hypothetical protein
MTDTKDGGFAFPCPADDKSGWSAEYGMTLRDWFAGQALNGIVAGLCASIKEGDSALARVRFDRTAADAYYLANAMLAAREVKE